MLFLFLQAMLILCFTLRLMFGTNRNVRRVSVRNNQIKKVSKTACERKVIGQKNYSESISCLNWESIPMHTPVRD